MRMPSLVTAATAAGPQERPSTFLELFKLRERDSHLSPGFTRLSVTKSVTSAAGAASSC